jgi:hypothetical protein
MRTNIVPIRFAFLVLLAAILGLDTAARAQEMVNIIMPQGRHPVIAPHPRHGQPVQLRGVEASVSINEQVATTTLVLTLHNPSRV